MTLPRLAATLLAALAAALFSGCSQIPTNGSMSAVLGAARASFSSRHPATVQVTRAQLRASRGSFMLASLPADGSSAILGTYGRNGDIVTYATQDLTEVSLRNGLVIATHGLPQDVDTVIPPSLAQIAAVTPGGVDRAQFYVTETGRIERHDFVCTLSDLGEETITIVQIAYRVRHVESTCAGFGTSFINHYWFGPGNLLRKSRQWISPLTGYLEIENLDE